MSEQFINRARARLADARALAATSPSAGRLAEALEALARVVETTIDAVDRDGCLPSSVCTAVVKYGRAGRCEEPAPLVLAPLPCMGCSDCAMGNACGRRAP